MIVRLDARCRLSSILAHNQVGERRRSMTKTYCDRCEVEVDLPYRKDHVFEYMSQDKFKITVTVENGELCKGCIQTIIAESVPDYVPRQQ